MVGTVDSLSDLSLINKDVMKNLLLYPHSAQSKSKQSSQRNSQPPTQNDAGTGKEIRCTHIVLLFFVNLDMIKQLLLLIFIFLKNGKYLPNISSNNSYCI